MVFLWSQAYSLPYVVSIDFWQYKVEVEVEIKTYFITLSVFFDVYIYTIKR